MNLLSRIAIAITFTAIAGTAVAHAGVIRVDAAGGGDFTDLQAAIDAAVAGDILLVHPGVYGTNLFGMTQIVGKGITITADPPSSTFQVFDRVIVGSVPAGQTVVLRGVTRLPSVANSFTDAPGIFVTHCAGAVMIEDCNVIGWNGFSSFGFTIAGSSGIAVEFSAAVSIVRTTATGGPGAAAIHLGSTSSNPSTAGGRGLRVVAAKVTLHDSVFKGGVGGAGAVSFPASPGGIGGTFEAAHVFGSGCSFVGGSSSGGGLAIMTPVAPVLFLDSTFTPNGTGAAIVDPAGALQQLPGTARHFVVSSPVREQALGTVTVDGEVGDVAILFIGLDGDAIQMHGVIGLLQVSLPLQGPFVLGALPAPAGVLTFSVPAPDLVLPGLLGFTSILQPFVVSGADVYAAPPSSFVLVDSSL